MRGSLWALPGVVFAALLLATPRVVAQTGGYADPSCGVAFNPEPLQVIKLNNGSAFAWTRVQRSPTGLTVFSDGDDYGGFIAEARNITADESADLKAAADAARYCLACLQNRRLAWIDRFREGTMAVRYLVYEETARQYFGNDTFPERPGYTLHYFMSEGGQARNLGEGGKTTAQAFFWTPVELLARTEPAIHRLIRSVRFSVPTGQCRT